RGSGAPFDGPGYTGAAPSADSDANGVGPGGDATGVLADRPVPSPIMEATIATENRTRMALVRGGGSEALMTLRRRSPRKPPTIVKSAIVNIMAAANTAIRNHLPMNVRGCHLKC